MPAHSKRTPELVEAKHDVVRGACEIVFPDGSRYAQEWDRWASDHWVNTPFGPFNCGIVTLGPARTVKVA